jgi:perosamine synthetase
MIPRRQTPIAGPDVVRAWRAARRDPAGELLRFEATFAQATWTRHAVAACSGRTALLATLRAAGLRPGDELVLPALTLVDLPALLRNALYVPVFADVDPDTLLIDPADVARVRTSRTRAIVPTDLFGVAADWFAALGPLAARHDIVLIEDAAHAAGTRVDGRPVGGLTDAVFFSLETIKVLHAFGGGVVTTDDARLAERVRAQLPKDPQPPLRVPSKFARNALENLLFRTPAYQAALAGLDVPPVRRALLAGYDRLRQGGVATQSEFSPWQAAFASMQLPLLADRVARRRALAARLMTGLPDWRWQTEPAGVESNRYFLVGQPPWAGQGTPPADLPIRLRRALLRMGVDVGIGSEVCDFCPGFLHADLFPHAFAAWRGFVQLPVFADMSDAQADRVVEAVRRATASAARETT